MSTIFIISFSFSLLAASVNTCLDICVSKVSVQHPAYNFNEKDEHLNAMSSENMILRISISFSFSPSRLFIIILLEKKKKKKEKENSGRLYLILVKSIYIFMQRFLHLTLIKS